MPIFVERTETTVVRSSFRELPTMEELTAFFAWSVRSMQQRTDPYAVILDIRTAATPPLNHLKAQAAFFREHGDTISASILGAVFVADSPMLRGALKALFWMQEPPTRTLVLRSLDEAKNEIATWLEEAGVSSSIPPFEDNPAIHGQGIASLVAPSG